MANTDKTHKQPQTDNSDEQGLKGPLEKALQENFNHARHQENQRERYMTMYWFLWAAALAYVGRQGDFLNKVAENRYIFFFLLIMSIATLIVNLKWNAEFANHMAAAAAIAKKLGLNYSTKYQEETPNKPLPYPEFRGYMALPLKFPAYLSVGAWLSVIHSFGLALSVWLLVYGWTTCVIASLVVGILSGICGVLVCFIMYKQMERGIQTRIPGLQRPEVNDRVEVITGPYKGKRGTIIELKESRIPEELCRIAKVRLDETGDDITCQGPDIIVLNGRQKTNEKCLTKAST